MHHSPLTEVGNTCECSAVQCKLGSGEISFLVVNFRTVTATVLDEYLHNETVMRLVLMHRQGRRDSFPLDTPVKIQVRT